MRLIGAVLASFFLLPPALLAQDAPEDRPAPPPRAGAHAAIGAAVGAPDEPAPEAPAARDAATTEKRQIRVAVVPFVVSQSTQNPLVTMNYREKMSHYVSDILTNLPHITVVERDIYNHPAPEPDVLGINVDDFNLDNFQTMGALFNANYVALGSLHSIDISNRALNAEGLQATQQICKASFGLKIVNTSTGKVFFSDSENAVKKITQTATLQRNITESDFEELSKKAIEKLGEKLKAKIDDIVDEPLGEKPELVRVTFMAKPEGADVLVDNIYVGPAPGENLCPKGFHTMTIKYQGHLPWNKRIEIHDGMQVEANLRDMLIDARDRVQILNKLAERPNVEIRYVTEQRTVPAPK